MLCVAVVSVKDGIENKSVRSDQANPKDKMVKHGPDQLDEVHEIHIGAGGSGGGRKGLATAVPQHRSTGRKPVSCSAIKKQQFPQSNASFRGVKIRYIPQNPRGCFGKVAKKQSSGLFALFNDSRLL